jgi:hypothetical protein
MRKNTLCILFLLSFICEFAQGSLDVNRLVKIDFTQDAKKRDITGKFNVYFVCHGVDTIEPYLFRNGIVLPKFGSDSMADVIFECGKYRLAFPQVYIQKLFCDWSIDLDTYPFTEEHKKGHITKRLRQVYSITFHPEEGDGTVETCWKYSKR